jgi:hypothetical protein
MNLFTNECFHCQSSLFHGQTEICLENTQHFSFYLSVKSARLIMKTIRLILLTENTVICFQNHKEHKNTACVCKMRGILMLKQVVPIVTTELLKVK